MKQGPNSVLSRPKVFVWLMNAMKWCDADSFLVSLKQNACSYNFSWHPIKFASIFQSFTKLNDWIISSVLHTELYNGQSEWVQNYWIDITGRAVSTLALVAKNYIIFTRSFSIVAGTLLGRSDETDWSIEKPKRMRTIFTVEQLERLEREFTRQQYMVGGQRFYLSKELGLTETQVKVWFQNRRIKWRKQLIEQQRSKVRYQKEPSVSAQEENDCS